jgi:hypothetical protein
MGLALTGTASALEEPVVWRDTDTGCAYLLTPSGGIALRYKRDGTADCPDAGNPGVIDETARGIARGLDTLQREVERLREGYNQRR